MPSQRPQVSLDSGSAAPVPAQASHRWRRASVSVRLTPVRSSASVTTTGTRVASTGRTPLPEYLNWKAPLLNRASTPSGVSVIFGGPRSASRRSRASRASSPLLAHARVVVGLAPYGVREHLVREG